MGQVSAVRAGHVLAREFHALVHQGKRQHEGVRADPDPQALDDRQGERDPHHDAGSLAAHAGDVDRAAQGLYGPLHHVHADAAP